MFFRALLMNSLERRPLTRIRYVYQVTSWNDLVPCQDYRIPDTGGYPGTMPRMIPYLQLDGTPTIHADALNLERRVRQIDYVLIKYGIE